MDEQIKAASASATSNAAHAEAVLGGEGEAGGSIAGWNGGTGGDGVILGCSTLLQFVFWFECRVIKHAGLDLKQFVEGIKEGAAGSKALEIFGERMIERDFRPGGFAEYQVANGQGKLGTQGVISVIQNINGMNQ